MKLIKNKKKINCNNYNNILYKISKYNDINLPSSGEVLSSTYSEDFEHPISPLIFLDIKS
jgi:hypothetical protein